MRKLINHTEFNEIWQYIRASDERTLAKITYLVGKLKLQTGVITFFPTRPRLFIYYFSSVLNSEKKEVRG